MQQLPSGVFISGTLIRRRFSVLQVTCDRTAKMRQMRPDLMRAAGDQIDVKKGRLMRAAQDIDARHHIKKARHFFVRHDNPV